MPIGPHIHDPSGHRYGKGELPLARIAGAAQKAFASSRKNKRDELEKQRKDAEKNKKKDKAPKEDAPKEKTESGTKVQLTVDDKIPVRPSGPRPAPVRVGTSGKFEPEPAYGERKQAETDFNAGLREQLILQNHSSSQFGEHMITVPGKPMRATGYGPTNKKTGTTNKAQMGKIQETAQRIQEIKTRNAAVQKPPVPDTDSASATGKTPKTPSAT
jgi:hypothetical protein